MAIIKKIRDLKRFKQIVTIFFEQGLGHIISESHLSQHIPFLKRIQNKEVKDSLPIRVRKSFENLGPTFVKLGQLLSLRPDLIPYEYIIEFEKMQDRVPGFPYTTAKKIVEQELGQPISKIFKSFDKKPIASASLGQVHKAILLNGKQVAVKIQRPNIRKNIKTDLEIMEYLAILLDKHVKELKNYKLPNVIEEFKKWTEDELNYKIEAINAITIKQNFKNNPDVHIPLIYSDLTTEKILVMEYIDGTQINQIKNINKYIDKIFELIIIQAYEHGFFHADPHPANILIDKQGKIAFIDFGIIGQMDEDLKNKSIDIFAAIVDNDLNLLLRSFISLGVVDDEIDKMAFKRDLNELIGQLRYTSLKNIEIGRVLQKMFNLAIDYKIKIPVDYVKMAKMIITIEGIGLKYNPNFKLAESSKPILQKILKKRYHPKTLLNNVKRNAIRYNDLLMNFPDAATEIIERLRSGKIKVDINKDEIRSLTMELEQSSGNLAIGMIIAAIIVGASLIYQTEAQLLYKGVHIIPVIGFIIAALLAAWLLHRTIFSKLVKRYLR